MGTQHQHSHIWIFGGNHLGRLNAVHVGHADIHDHQVRTLLLQPGKSFASCRCLGDYDDVRFRIQDLSQAFPEKDMVISKDYADLIAHMLTSQKTYVRAKMNSSRSKGIPRKATPGFLGATPLPSMWLAPDITRTGISLLVFWSRSNPPIPGKRRSVTIASGFVSAMLCRASSPSEACNTTPPTCSILRANRLRRLSSSSTRRILHPRRTSGLKIGKSAVTHPPPAGVFSRWMYPRAMSQIRLTEDRPRPTPLSFAVIKGSTRRCGSSSGNPHPVSFTRKCILLSCFERSTCISPGPEIASTALVRIWEIRECTSCSERGTWYTPGEISLWITR